MRKYFWDAVEKLAEIKTVKETLEAITSGFLMAKFVEVAEAEGVELKVSYYSRYYTFRMADEKVRSNKLINSLRVRLYCDEGVVAVYEIKDEPVYLVEIWKDRGRNTYLEMIRLHYYYGEDEPDKEPLGYISVDSHSIIGLMVKKDVCELIEVLIEKGWKVDL